MPRLSVALSVLAATHSPKEAADAIGVTVHNLCTRLDNMTDTEETEMFALFDHVSKLPAC